MLWTHANNQVAFEARGKVLFNGSGWLKAKSKIDFSSAHQFENPECVRGFAGQVAVWIFFVEILEDCREDVVAEIIVRGESDPVVPPFSHMFERSPGGRHLA